VLLEDGAWFAGTTPFPFEPSYAEVVFTTNLSGYQEVFTDPSYLGQLVVMTAPMIGNYGINPEDVESDRPRVAGVVVRELSARPSNWRSTGSLLDWLTEARVPIVAGVDTRQLTRHIRSKGAMRGVIAPGERPTPRVRELLEDSPRMDGLDLASRATVGAEYVEGPLDARHHVVAFDFGMKRNILRLFAKSGCRVTVVRLRRARRGCASSSPTACFSPTGRETRRQSATPCARFENWRSLTFPSLGSVLGTSCWGWRSVARRSSCPTGIGAGITLFAISRRGKCLSLHRTTASPFGAMSVPFPARKHSR
jgi:carbamoyl-phosphate synthase small subunit